MSLRSQTLPFHRAEYAKWYTISKEDGGKSVKVSIASNASFAVYDANGKCIYF